MHTASVIARRSHALVAAAVVLAAVLAAGCGGTTGALPPELSSFTNVAQTSAAADSASFSLEANVSVPGIDKQLAFNAKGAFDAPAKRSQMSVDLSSVAELMKSFGSEPRWHGHGRPRQPRGLEARGDPGRRHRVRPLPAAREAAARRQDLAQGRRQDTRPPTQVSWSRSARSRQDRPARRLRDAQGGLRLDRSGRARTSSAGSRRVATRRRSRTSRSSSSSSRPRSARTARGASNRAPGRQGSPRSRSRSGSTASSAFADCSLDVDAKQPRARRPR